MDLTSVRHIQGPQLTLRLIRPEDAAYVHGLRMDPRYNAHLSPVQGTAEDQRRWIEGYKQREARGIELYYVIERHDGQSCGLVRLYEIGPECFTWGSWMLDAGKPPKAALESAVLSFDVGFRLLGRPLAKVDVRIDNTHAEAFYRRLGMVETHRSAQDIFFDYHRDTFLADRPGYLELLDGLAAPK